MNKNKISLFAMLHVCGGVATARKASRVMACAGWFLLAPAAPRVARRCRGCWLFVRCGCWLRAFGRGGCGCTNDASRLHIWRGC